MSHTQRIETLFKPPVYDAINPLCLYFKSCHSNPRSRRYAPCCRCIAYLGEGAANQGAFHESLNLAAVWKLPVVFVIEDNSWGISVSKKQSTAIERNYLRAAGYGMPGKYVPDRNL